MHENALDDDGFLPILPTPATDAATIADTLTLLEAINPGVLAYAIDHPECDRLDECCVRTVAPIRRMSGGGMTAAYGTYQHRRYANLLG